MRSAHVHSPSPIVPLCLIALGWISSASFALADEPTAVNPSPRQLVVEQAEAMLDQLGNETLDTALLDRQQRMLESLQLLLTADQRSPAKGSTPSTEAESTSSSESVEGAPQRPATVGTIPAPHPADGTQPKALRPLADAIWGHLPPRERDELYQSFSEQYLPQYDDALRRYFRALAEMQDAPAAREDVQTIPSP